VQKVQLDDGVKCWAFSSSQYVQAAVKNAEEYLSKRDDVNWNLPKKAETPMWTVYHPELNVSPELQPENAAYYDGSSKLDVWTFAWNALCCHPIWRCPGRDTYTSYSKHLST
jgi:hypothetical protein